MEKKDVLFLGNGINYLSGDNVYSWEKLLRDLMKSIYKDYEIDVIDFKNSPFTLLYNEIEQQMEKTNLKNKNFDIKTELSKILKKIHRNDYHRKIMDLEFEHIITTNCDYNLECSIKTDFKSVAHRKSVIKEKKHNIFRCIEINNTKIWHIHGEMDKPNSFTFGYDHYSENLKNIIDYTQKGLNFTKQHKSSILLSLKNNKEIKIDSKKFESWIDVFLFSNIHILGLSLDYTEIALWYIIMLKGKSYSKFPDGQIGKTYFYHLYSDKISEYENSKLALLSTLGVEIYTKNVFGKYRIAYDKFLDYLSSQISLDEFLNSKDEFRKSNVNFDSIINKLENFWKYCINFYNLNDIDNSLIYSISLIIEIGELISTLSDINNPQYDTLTFRMVGRKDFVCLFHTINSIHNNHFLNTKVNDFFNWLKKNNLYKIREDLFRINPNTKTIDCPENQFIFSPNGNAIIVAMAGEALRYFFCIDAKKIVNPENYKNIDEISQKINNDLDIFYKKNKAFLYE